LKEVKSENGDKVELSDSAGNIKLPKSAAISTRIASKMYATNDNLLSDPRVMYVDNLLSDPRVKTAEAKLRQRYLGTL